MVAQQQKRKGNAIIFNGLMNLFAMIQFILLSAFSGAFIKLSNVLRNIVLYILNKKGKATPIWLAILFVCMAITGGLLGWKNWFSILPIIGVSAFTMALCQKNMTIIRGTNLFTLSCWLVYNLVTGAYGGAIGISAELCSGIVAVVRLDILKRFAKG
jgi:hypothetical protein